MEKSEEIFREYLLKNKKNIKIIVINAVILAATIGGLTALLYFIEPFHGTMIVVLAILLIFIVQFALTISKKIKEPFEFISTMFSFIIIIALTPILFFVITLLYYPTIGERISSGITKEKILALNLGMNKESVIKIMGKPIKAIGRNDKACYDDRKFCSLAYATSGLHGFGFAIYLNFIGNKLDEVYVKRNDFTVYLCSTQYCPGIVGKDDFEELILRSLK